MFFLSFQISVSDNGNPNLSSTARVLVKVLDENDNAPDFGVHTHRVRILRPKPGSKKNPVLRVFAVDKDEGYNSQLSYKIQGKRISKFYVEKSSGQIYVDDIETGSHSFRVCLVACSLIIFFDLQNIFTYKTYLDNIKLYNERIINF